VEVDFPSNAGSRSFCAVHIAIGLEVKRYGGWRVLYLDFQCCFGCGMDVE